LSDAERAVVPADFLAYEDPVSGTFIDYVTFKMVVDGSDAIAGKDPSFR
jgi:hypothetical protein